jgi:hypothetical protein
MPTVFIWRGYRFHFFSNEGMEPPHIHVSKDSCEAKFWLKDCSLAYNDDFKHNEIRKLNEIIRKNRKILMEKWNERHKNHH